MKKKILFTAYNLDIGGVETSLVNLLLELNNIYDITLILEKKEGIFLDKLPESIKVLEYKTKSSKFILYRKICNRLKLIKWRIKLKNKYDFSCSYATHYEIGARLALVASENNALWIHSNYYVLSDKDQNKMKMILDSLCISKFKKLIFVSQENMQDVVSNYSGIASKSIVCNNFIDYKSIIDKSKEKIEFKRTKNPLFVNVGRHEEIQKKLSRIINSAKKLKDEGYKFQVLFIGDGPNNKEYREKVTKKDLEDTIIFLGKKQNPFPYYKLADAIILSSDFEGFPVVFLESMTLEKPILSTRVSDWEELDGIYGVFCEPSEIGIYNMMKEYLNKGFILKEKFDAQKYNKKIKEKIIDIIEHSI